jgi:AcrR family transcriptional regulator
MQNPGRPREFDPDEILSKIMQLFWEGGYEATGLSDIIAATGLGKASLYATFGNKQSMYLKALSQYEALVVDAAVGLLRDTAQTPQARIGTFISLPVVALRDHQDRRGCFLCNASADRGSLDAQTATLVQRGYEKMRLAIVQALREMQPDQSTAQIEGEAALVLAVYSGLRVMARSGMPVAVLMASRDEVLRAVGVV